MRDGLKWMKRWMDEVLQCYLGWRGTDCSGGSQEKSAHIVELKAADSWEEDRYYINWV